MSPTTEEQAMDYIKAPRTGTDDVIALRDYFAAAALQGMLANYAAKSKSPVDKFAAAAYTIADAMLTVRAK
jgi:hypothetical protein